MIKFLTDYWQLIVVVGSGLIELVLMILLKRRPQVVDNSFVFQLSEWILEAENIYVNGSDKLQYVLEKSKSYLGDKFVKKDVVALVEWILTIPEKKKEGK